MSVGSKAPFYRVGRGLGAHSPGLYGTGSEGSHPQRSQPSSASPFPPGRGSVSGSSLLLHPVPLLTPRAQRPPRVPERQVQLALQPERGACPPWAGPRQPYGVAFTGPVSPPPAPPPVPFSGASHHSHMHEHTHTHTRTHRHMREHSQTYTHVHAHMPSFPEVL